jgi:hypothetical protein
MSPETLDALEEFLIQIGMLVEPGSNLDQSIDRLIAALRSERHREIDQEEA